MPTPIYERNKSAHSISDMVCLAEMFAELKRDEIERYANVNTDEEEITRRVDAGVNKWFVEFVLAKNLRYYHASLVAWDERSVSPSRYGRLNVVIQMLGEHGCTLFFSPEGYEVSVREFPEIPPCSELHDLLNKIYNALQGKWSLKAKAMAGDLGTAGQKASHYSIF